MKNTIIDFIKAAGPIRMILYVMGIITIIFKPDNASTLNLEGLNFIPTLILPVIAPMLITGYLLDMLMSRIYAAEQPEDVKRKYKLISRVDLVLTIIMLVLWVPFLLAKG